MEQLFNGLINPILQALVLAIVPVAITYGLNLLKKKTNIQINKDTEDMLTTIAKNAVLSVEETALNALKTGATKWTSSMKQGAAVDQILSMAPTLTTTQALALVNSAVASVKGVGASAEVGK